MGVVYEAFDRQGQQRVALKTLLNFDATGLYQFKQEFRTLADVLHPNLVHLYELVAGDDHGVFFTMELVEGEDFLKHVQKVGEHLEDSPADFDKLRPALRQLVEGVRALHAAGKLHRDLKPSNVRVTPNGRVVILDFGVATELRKRRETSGEDDLIVGTVSYMAPEQASGEAPVVASDWYSVGSMLYEAIVGSPPFVGSVVDALTAKVMTDPTPPSARVRGVPDDINALCMDLLHRDPERRPSAMEILRRLGAIPSDRAPAPVLVDGLEATKLFGRETHLQALDDAFRVARSGGAISVHVAGMSGMGKSAVVHHFLDQLEKRGRVLVLRGRAYERESMPYKAVDSIVDALSRHLMSRQGREDASPLPGDVRAIAELFPVLGRLPGAEPTARAPAGDRQVVRQRAFAALREVFAWLAEECPVVVFIDDAQWGDVDSVALLVELMRPPRPPPLLLLTTHRTEEALQSPFLAELRARWPEDAEVREIDVGPLDPNDARSLALDLLGATGAAAEQTADSIARESAGNPFLLEELARGASAYHRIALGGLFAASAPLTLDQMLSDRAARLPGDARRLLETIAVGGRPLLVSTVGRASGLEASAPQLVALLRTRRFVRAGLRDGRETVETSHDRVRETIVAQMLPSVARDHHARLARVLETIPDSEPEAIATHLIGAGDRDRAAGYAERAAQQATDKLAFAQAARLYELILDTISAASPEAHRLRLRLAEACEWAGHAEKAARAYFAAAEGVPARERIDLERAAAAQLMAAGRIDEGAAACRRVLFAVGRKVPTSVLATIFWAIVFRIIASLRYRSELGPPRELGREERVRLEALHAVSRSLAVVDPISSMYVKARYLADAFRSRDRVHLVRAATAEASMLASAGKRVSNREKALFDLARRLAEESGDQEGYGLYAITYGISLYLRGRWGAATKLLDGACAKLAAARRWNANAYVYATYSLAMMGELREVKARTTRLLADAEQRGDVYTAVNLRASHPMSAWLAADEVVATRRHVREALGQWSKTNFLVQHWQGMLWEAETDLYASEGQQAWDRLARDERALRRSHLLSVQLIRTLTQFIRGRSAIASLDALQGQGRLARLAHAKDAAARLERESMPWAAALASMVTAGVANAAGDPRRSESALRHAIERAEAAEMSLHAAATRHRLGLLLGGDEGAAMVRAAEESMKAKGVRVPERYAGMLMPGHWGEIARTAGDRVAAEPRARATGATS
jgi:predicted ATPase